MPERQDESLLRNYEFFCLACLLVMLLALIQRDTGLGSLIPLLVGLGGIAGRWRMAPALLLGALVMLLTGLLASLHAALWHERAVFLDESDVVTDLLLAAAVLGYIAGQLRLRGLADGLFPADPRLPKGTTNPLQRAELGREIALLVVSLLIASVGALFAWEQLPDRGLGLGFSVNAWRLLVLIWMLGMGGIVAAGLTGYISWRGRTATEAALFLQDVLWRETRGEQRRLYRWAAWRRLRALRRKERS